MVQASDVAKHMEVVGSDGGHVGTVDHVEGDRIKLARKDQRDGDHHFLPISAIARVDDKVHLSSTAAATLALFAGAGGAAGVAPGRRAAPPPAAKRGILPWILAIVGVILLLLLLRSCFAHKEEAPAASTAGSAAPATAPLAVEAVRLPDGTSVNLAPDTLNYELQRYLASSEAAPRTFTFDKLNFDTGSSTLRAQDQPTIDALARILAAYPKTGVKIVGYTDARGATPGNALLGRQRADTVVAALAAKGFDKARAQAASGGESNPVDTNATAQGQFDNRRTEFVVVAK